MADQTEEEEKEKAIPDTIDGREILSSGSVTILSGQKFVLHPFDDDPEYAITPEVTFYPLEGEGNKEGSSSLTLDADPDKRGTIIRFLRGFENGRNFANAEAMSFAGDEDATYFCNFAFTSFGKIEQYTLIIHYTVWKEENV
jgi:hypothetical protein